MPHDTPDRPPEYELHRLGLERDAAVRRTEELLAALEHVATWPGTPPPARHAMDALIKVGMWRNLKVRR